MKASDKYTRVLENIARPSNRSPLFWWMLDRHDEILALAAGRRIQWKQLCLGITETGITDTTGKPVKERNARETWRQVRLEKARLEALTLREEEQRELRAAAREERRRDRMGAGAGNPTQAPGVRANWPAPIAVRSDQPQEGRAGARAGFGLPAKVSGSGEPMTKEEYLRRRNARGADGFLTDEAIRLRDRELKTSLRGEDLWMALTYKDDEK